MLAIPRWMPATAPPLCVSNTQSRPSAPLVLTLATFSGVPL